MGKFDYIGMFAVIAVCVGFGLVVAGSVNLYKAKIAQRNADMQHCADAGYSYGECYNVIVTGKEVFTW